MKLKNIILFLAAVMAISSCKDMFEPAMENTRDEETMYEEPDYAAGLLNYGYQYLPFDKASVSDIATDDAVTNEKSNGYMSMALGSWTASNNPMSQWNQRKCCIQYLNLFLATAAKVKWAGAESVQQMFVDRQMGEAYALRALHYYYLLVAHGGYANDGVLYGVPLLTAPETAESDFNQPRATFADCVKQICQDVDSAMARLPEAYEDLKLGEDNRIPERYRKIGAEYGGYNRVFGSSSKGRMTSIVAEAIRAQVALLAASPAFADQSGVTSEQAANYAAAVLKHVGGVSGLDPMGHIWYMNKDYLERGAEEMPEVIWRDNHQQESALEESYYPPSLYGKGSVNPSQNLVDAFPAANGYPITDAKSGYDANNPYANRDPRLSAYIITNESEFHTATIITGTYPDANDLVDDNINQVTNSTRTGYYLKKLLRDDVTIKPSKNPQWHVYCRIRYTEIFLAYAEAANEAWGPTGTGNNGYSAYDVIKAIRQRAGITDGDEYLESIKSDKSAMTNLIRNERRLELCFENKRFWDLRRWKMPLNETIMGVQIDKDDDGVLSYKPITVEERNYNESYMWYGPIPQDEDLKWSNLLQNKGW